MRSFPYPIPEEKKVRVILDTDCACEADDPYAIVHALLSPKISVTGICAEHFADRFGPDSMEESYREILHVLDLAGLNGQVPVFRGSPCALSDETTSSPSPASQFIIQEALRDDPRPLFIAGQGALTNVASALLEKPEIADRFTLVWIGGGTYPDGESEFNAENDIAAANVLFGSAVELWQVPKNLYSKMTVPFSVLHEKVAPCGEIGQYLFQRVIDTNYKFVSWIKRPGYTPAAAATSYPGGEMWILGDSPAIGLILFDERYSFVYRPAPRFTPDSRYLPAPDPQRLIRVYTEIDREFILSDFYAKLLWHFGADPK